MPTRRPLSPATARRLKASTCVARLHVQLAEAGLKRVQAMNQRLAKTVSADVVAAYQHDLDVAKLRLKLASPDAKGNHFDLWLERARADAAADEAVWRAADTANQKSPGVLDPNEVERLRLAFELDKLELQRGEALASGPVEGRVEWELCLVNTEIQRLKGQLRSSAIGGGMNPVLGY